MYNKSIIGEKSKRFAIRIIKLYKYLNAEKKEFVISKRILCSGTSIGANVKRENMVRVQRISSAK